LRYDATSRKQLHLIEPWVTYGIPSKAVINDLIRRRGHGKLDGKRIPLSDNTIVEKALGDSTDGSVICIDDMVHELETIGDQFKKVNTFLWSFQLSALRSKFRKEKLNFKDGGDYGDRGEEIDDLIRQML
jgi:large subunit ribosomal protein L7e